MANYSYNVCGNLLLLIFNVSRTWLGVEDKSLWKLWRNLKKNFKFPDYIQKKWRNLWDSLYLLFSCEITGAAIRTVSGQILKKQLITLFLHSWKLLNKLLELDLEIIASVHSLSGLQDSFRIEWIGIFPWFFVQSYSKELFKGSTAILSKFLSIFQVIPARNYTITVPEISSEASWKNLHQISIWYSDFFHMWASWPWD